MTDSGDNELDKFRETQAEREHYGMTNTPQDNEAALREQAKVVILRAYSASFTRDKVSFNEDDYRLIDHYTNEIMQLITERERAAFEAGKRAYTENASPYTKQWLADQLGISRPTLNAWLADPDKFTVGAVKKLAALTAPEDTPHE